jgi:ATP-dependent exoDNAse (exonuclease V) beta subunit
MPHPKLPEEESFRDLSRLYVAMTRAKTQLLVSYSGAPSRFVEVARDAFTEASFDEHAEPADLKDITMPAAALPKLHEPVNWRLDGRQFVKTLDAIGLPRPVQDVITTKVTGVQVLQGSRRKQVEWKDFESFYATMQDARKRHLIISEGSWQALYEHFG